MIRAARWRQLQEAALDQPSPTDRLKRVLAAITLEDLAVKRVAVRDNRGVRVYKGARLLDAMSQIEEESA